MRLVDARDYLKNTFTLGDATRGLSRIRDRFSAPLLVLMAMVGTLLLIACGNVANLLIAREVGRQKEIAVRLSLGASAAAIIRMILLESLVLSTAGGVLALLVASWSRAFLLRLLPFESFGRAISSNQLDTHVLLFTGAVSILTAIVFGLLPALQVAKQDLTVTLKSEAHSVVGGHLKFRKALVAAQVALSLLLLVGAGLFGRSLYSLLIWSDFVKR